jgi:hypothetical protein
VDFSLFKGKWDTLQPKFDFLLQQFPRFNEFSEKASKKGNRSGFLVDIFDILFVTNKEEEMNPKIRKVLNVERESEEVMSKISSHAYFCRLKWNPR